MVASLQGTGIETHVNGKVKITLHKKDKLPAKVKGLDFPLIENDEQYIVMGFSYKDYLASPEFKGKNPQNEIFGAGADLDKAMTGGCMARMREPVLIDRLLSLASTSSL